MSLIEECDCCHDTRPLSWIQFTGAQFLCGRCIDTPKKGVTVGDANNTSRPAHLETPPGSG